MTQQTGREYAEALRARYRAATKHEKGPILDEYCRTTGCHRKAALRRMRRGPLRRGWPRRYGPALVPLLRRLWELSNRPCAKLLAPCCPCLSPRRRSPD